MFIKRSVYKDKLELIDIYRNKNKSNVDRINDYKEQVYDLRKNIHTLEEQQTKLYEQNQKLTNWVVQILKEFGTTEIGDRRHIEIPIHKTCSKAYFNNIEDMYIKERERIEIPSITIVKMS